MLTVGVELGRVVDISTYRPRSALSEMKVCRRCHLNQPISNYTVTDRQYGYRRGHCKKCEATRVRARYHSNEEYRESVKAATTARRKVHGVNPAVTRKSMLKGKYGLTIESYAALLAAQGGCCALCGADKEGRVGKDQKWSAGNFNVDHCHEDGRVRGLLCRTCNVALGAYERLLKKAGEAKLLDYLTRPSPVAPSALPVIVPQKAAA